MAEMLWSVLVQDCLRHALVATAARQQVAASSVIGALHACEPGLRAARADAFSLCLRRLCKLLTGTCHQECCCYFGSSGRVTWGSV